MLPSVLPFIALALAGSATNAMREGEAPWALLAVPPVPEAAMRETWPNWRQTAEFRAVRDRDCAASFAGC